MLKTDAAKLFIKAINSNKIARNIALKALDGYMYKTIVTNEKDKPVESQKHKYYFTKAMIECAMRNMDKGYISEHARDRIVETLVDNSFTGNEEQIAKFQKKYEILPPTFLVLSPYAGCNLKCTGCYAASTSAIKTQLPWNVVHKIATEVHNSWGSRFIVISGGEPFMYNDGGKTLLDLFEAFPDIFFLVYTNSTMITEDVAKRLAKLGNVTPAISVEGYEKETDERRGKGVYKIILSKMEILKKYGVPFGVSVTATKKNAELLQKDEFYDRYFKELGATYMWMFQYMPIGRGIDVNLMVTPEQRIKLFRTWQRQLKDNSYLVADFWNSGVLSDGCIAYGKGHFYIDWTGNIMPCAFVPYHVDNILDLYKQGKGLNDALMSPFFKRGREWQKKYGSCCGGKPKNLLMPCSTRDNYKTFREEILGDDVIPNDINAQEAHTSKEYYDGMVKYGEELKELSEPIWQEEFLKEE